MIEQWRQLAGRPIYEISNLGRLRNVLTGRFLSGTIVLQPTGKVARLQIVLGLGGSRRCVGIHILVLETFIGPRPSNLDGCHGDGNPLNNRLDNLRWDTRNGNLADTVRHGTKLVGERCNGAKLTAEKVLAMRSERNDGRTLRYLADRYGVSHSMVWFACHGHSWRHLNATGQ